MRLGREDELFRLDLDEISPGTEQARLVAECLARLPEPYFSPAVRLGPSGIAGRGLIAVRDIDAGEILVVERGPRTDGLTVRDVARITGFETNCCVGWDEYALHAPLGDGCGAYINHSCDPNVGMVADAAWAAIRPIPAGTEGACDYGTFETMPGWTMACACGAAACRGTVTAEDHLLADVRARLGPWLAPYLRSPAAAGGV